MATKRVEQIVCDTCHSEVGVTRYRMNAGEERAEVDLCEKHDTLKGWFTPQYVIRAGTRKRRVLTMAEVEKKAKPRRVVKK